MIRSIVKVRHIQTKGEKNEEANYQVVDCLAYLEPTSIRIS